MSFSSRVESEFRQNLALWSTLSAVSVIGVVSLITGACIDSPYTLYVGVGLVVSPVILAGAKAVCIWGDIQREKMRVQSEDKELEEAANLFVEGTPPQGSFNAEDAEF